MCYAFCKNYTGKVTKKQGITYHSFPSDDLRRIEWMHIVRKQRKEEDWVPNNYSKICSNHFKTEDKYVSDKGTILLKKSAVPVFESPHDEYESDLYPITDRYENYALKKRIRKMHLEKQNLFNRNSNLSRQNKRLRQKVANMKTIIQNLKKKNIITHQQIVESERNNDVSKDDL